MASRKLLPSLLAACVAATTGCNLAALGPLTPKPTPAVGKTPKPVTPAASTAPGSPVTPGTVPGQPATALPGVRVPVTLSGRITLIAHAKLGLISEQGGGMVSDHGGGMVSDHGGGMVSDHGGGIISNNTGGIVANNSGGIVSNNAATYRVAQAAAPADLATFGLADAVVTFTDAAGQPVRDAQGQPIQVTSDATGAYALEAALPAGNLVAHVKLHASAGAGAELTALVARSGSGPMKLDLSAASTFGAAFVLGRFVKGDQKVFDRLPQAEAERLSRELDAARGWLGRVPSYQPADMVAAADALRLKVPAVGQVIEDVRALLLGQSDLGNGRPATEVPVTNPGSFSVDPDGALNFSEGFLGRIRRIEPDGTIGTLMDAGNGRIKGNIMRLIDITREPGGTYVALSETVGIYRLDPVAGTVVKILGNLDQLVGGPAFPNGFASSVAAGPDGTLYFGVGQWDPKADGARVFAIKPDGGFEVLPLPGGRKGGNTKAVCPAADGSVYVAWGEPGDAASIFRCKDGVGTLVTRFKDGDLGDMVRAPDGTLYVSRPRARNVVAVAPDGTWKIVAGAGGPVGTTALLAPASLGLKPDGTLYIAEVAEALIYTLAPDGTFKAVAGSDARIEEGETTNFAINQPMGVAWGADGGLYITESGSSRLRRYKDGRLETLTAAGIDIGDKRGDGGPLSAARFGGPAGVAFRDGALWIGELLGGQIRHVDANGIVSTLASGGGQVAYGKTNPAMSGPGSAFSLAVDAQKRVVFTNATGGHQVLRYTPGAGGGTITPLVGPPRADMPDVYTPTNYLDRDEADPKAKQGMPLGVAIGPDGSPYYTEFVACRVVKVVDADGPGPTRLQRVAGRSVKNLFEVGMAGDGANVSADNVPATESTLVFPSGVAFDAAGNMYVSEMGTIHLGAMAGLASGGSAQEGLMQTVGAVLGVGSVAGRVRKVAKDGTITTVAGRGGRWFSADSGDDALSAPMAIAISPDGRMAIADSGANMIRILPAGSY